MSEFNRLRMELKTDIELIALRQEQMAKTMDHWSSRAEEQGHQMAEQGRMIAEQGQRINRYHQETARLGREVAEGQRWTQGRLRLLGERFDAVLSVVHAEHTDDHELLMELRERVERLEERDQPPAA